MPATADVRIQLPSPHDGQREVRAEARRFNVVACGRRWGKTTWGVDRAVNGILKGWPVGWFAPSYKYVQEVWRTVDRVLSPIVTMSNAQERRMEFRTGGTFEVWSFANDDEPGQSRAYQRAIIDEAGIIAKQQPDFIETGWQEAIRPTLADYEGDAWFLSTPKGKNAFYELYQWGAGDKREEWISWRMPTWTNPHIPKKEIAAMERDMTRRKYQQEVAAEFLDEVEGALWTWDLINGTRAQEHPDLQRIVVGVDPAGGGPDEVGIVACGRSVDGDAYVLEDASLRGSPNTWAEAVASAYRRHEADRVVAEKNFGGDMVESTLRTADANLPVSVISASRGKQQRAEPVAALYEQGKVHHDGRHDKLEDQMTTWDPAESGSSPDRVDALVWALTELMLEDTAQTPGIV